MVRPLEETKIWGHEVGGGRWMVFWARVESTPERKGKYSHKIRLFEALCDGKPQSLDSKMFLKKQTGKLYQGNQRITNLAHAIEKMNGLIMNSIRLHDSEFIFYQQDLQCIDEVNEFLDKYGDDY